MSPHAKIIEAFGGPAALQRMLGEACYQTVYNWKLRGIPAKHWPRLVHLAGKRGVQGVTLERLAARYGGSGARHASQHNHAGNATLVKPT